MFQNVTYAPPAHPPRSLLVWADGLTPLSISRVTNSDLRVFFRSSGVTVTGPDFRPWATLPADFSHSKHFTTEHRSYHRTASHYANAYKVRSSLSTCRVVQHLPPQPFQQQHCDATRVALATGRRRRTPEPRLVFRPASPARERLPKDHRRHRQGCAVSGGGRAGRRAGVAGAGSRSR